MNFWILILFLSKGNSIRIESSSLRTESLVEPLGIDLPNPKLSWRVENSFNEEQIAFEIRSANRQDDLETNPLWNSGQIFSHSTTIEWNGPTLKTRERIYWQVKIWNQNGIMSPWSSIGSFEMAILDQNQWNSSIWIENKNYSTGKTSLPYFIKRFNIIDQIVNARLLIVGLGQFIATINGQSTTTSVLNPGYFDWNKTIEYSTFNVTSLINIGDNVLGVALGKGIYRAEKPLDGRYFKFLTTPHPMKFICQLFIDFPNGSYQMIPSDSTWLTTVDGPLLESSWYGGEEYDGRKELSGWDTIHFNHSNWKSADLSSIPNPNATYRSRESPLIEPIEELRAVSVNQRGWRTYVFDFGINHAGWPKLKMRGERGTTVTMRPAELLDRLGRINQITEGTPIFDRYTFSGNDIETFMPTFRYHGFRYWQIENLAYFPHIDNATSYTLRVNNDIAGSFNSSIELFNRIHQNVNRAVQSNMFSVLTDCPHREKLGWLEETHLVFPSIQRFFDVQAHGRSIVRRIAEAQLNNGLVPSIAPEFPIFNGPFRDEPNWANSIILLPLYLYQSYGEKSVLDNFYPQMILWMNYLTSKAQDFIVSYGLGDWFAFDQSTPLGVTGTYGYWISAHGLSIIANALNKTSDATLYSELAKNISLAFHRTFFNQTSHTYATGSQAADVFALEMGAVPKEEEEFVVQHLINDIRQRGNHTSCGEVSLPSWFRMLSFYDHDDIIVDFLSRTDSPSYGYAIVHGATSLTEDWDGPLPSHGQSLTSQNHFMFGAVDQWFTRSLLGIEQRENSIDFRLFNIKPLIIPQLTHLQGTYRTTRGWIRLRWKRDQIYSTLEVTIPSGSQAFVYVSGKNVTTDDPKLIPMENSDQRFILFHVNVGTFIFHSILD